MQRRLPKPITCLIASLIALIPLLAVLSPQVTRAQDQPHVETNTALTHASFELVGGFRVPARNSTGPSTGFAHGGMGMEVDADGIIHLIVEGTTQDRGVHEFKRRVRDMGLADVPVEEWTLMVGDGYTPLKDVFPWGVGVMEDGFQHPQGLMVEGDTRLVAVRSAYATKPELDHWIAKRSADGAWTRITCALPAQQFAGFTRLPADVANDHFGGMSLAMTGGGLTGGQRGAAGPTMAVVSEDFSQTKIVLTHPTTAQVGADNDGTWADTAPGFPDYESLTGWVHPIRVIDGQRVGRFGSSSIRSSATWITHPLFEGMVYFSQRPWGDVAYIYQFENLALDRRSTLHLYSVDDLSRAYRGEITPGETRPQMIRFDRKHGQLRGLERGGHWDAANQLLWVYSTRAWSAGGSESYPILAAWRIVGGDTPDPEPEPTPDPEPEPDPTVALLERLSALEKAATANSQAIAELIEQMQALTSWSDATDERWRRLQAAVTSW